MANIFGSGGSSGGGSSGGGSSGGSSSGGGSSGGGGGGSSGGSSSSSGGGAGAGWGSLDAHTKMEYLGRLSDIMFPLLGRKPSMKEVEQWYNAGLSTYSTAMKIQMSKEYRHSADYKRKSGVLQVAINQAFGGRLNVKPRMIQSWIAHGYTGQDVEGWLYRHPHAFRQSNIYKDRYEALASAYEDTMGVSWYQQDRSFQKRVRKDTNKKKKGIQGNKYVTKTIPTATAAHLDQAAFHYQDPEKYVDYLKRRPEYQAVLALKTQSQHAQSQQINQQGRPITTTQQQQQQTPGIGA